MATEISSEKLHIVKIPNPSSHDEFIHCDTVGAANLTFLKRQKHCDVTFEVGQEKKEFQCHKSFLMSRSPVFETMFSENWDTSSGPILLPDVEPETFDSFLQFVYGDEFAVNIPMAIKVLQLGDKYDVRPLVQKCEKLMSKDIQLKDAFETFTIARRYSLQNLMDQAGELLARNFEVLSKQPSFRDIDEETLIYLLKRDDLLLAELKLFNIILRWASDNMEENSSYAEVLKNIIPLIRFPLMTAQEFATFVFPTQILPQKDVIDLFLYFNSDETVREEVAKRIQFSPARRKGSIPLKLYQLVPNSTNICTYDDINEILEYHQGHEDNYLLWYSQTESDGATNSKIVMLDSLLLEGPDYDILDAYWPSNNSPGLVYDICVTVEKLDLSGTATPVFMGNISVNKGEQTNLKFCPRIELAPGVKHCVTVKSQGDVLVIVQQGEREVDWNYDMLTNSKLTSTLSDSNLMGALQVELSKPASEYSDPDYIHVGPRPLHFLRELIVVN